MPAASLADRLSRVRETVAAACARAGSDAATVRLVAITKGHSAETLRDALDAGLREIGENRVQEAHRKFDELGAELTGSGAVRHLVGHLQRNKVRRAIDLFDWIQSIDSMRLAKAVSQRVTDHTEPIDVLAEINVAREPQRHGFDPDEAVDRALEIDALNGVQLRGLMGMAPWTDDEAVLRGAFREMRGLFEALKKQRSDGSTIDVLSMGMSNDYELAIEEGSTMIRLGTVLFGPRRERKNDG